MRLTPGHHERSRKVILQVVGTRKHLGHKACHKCLLAKRLVIRSKEELLWIHLQVTREATIFFTLQILIPPTRLL